MIYRTLDVEEWPRLLTDGIEPYATYGLPEPGHWIILAAIDEDGTIVGTSTLVETVQNHWYISPHTRRNPVVVDQLWQATRAVLDAHRVETIHATVSDDQPDVQAMVERLGYVPAPGKLYALTVARCLLNERT